jgi:paraquat-inducible protein B
MIVMYFEESIRGLSVGSSVVFKGVEVGKVVKIRLITDLEKGTFKTPVYMVLKDYRADDYSKEEQEQARETLNSLIKKGLRAKLISANFLTGQLMIELTMDPSQPAVMRGTGKYMEIPTELSSFAALSNDLQEVPLRETLSRLGNIIEDLEKNLPTILETTNQVTQKLDRILDKKSGEASKSLSSFNSTMEEIGKTSRSIKNLMDYLERHPEALIHGKEK